MKTSPDRWTSKGLLTHIRKLNADRPDRRLVFILGAGASVNSGIPAGGRLVDRWLEELHEQLCHGKDSLDEWATERNLGIKGFHYTRRAEFYPQVFERRYRRDRSEGYEALEKIMDRAKPSFGYSVLAQIMATTRHNVLITTNFDNLVADAMATYSGRHPLMVGHESLAGYARARVGRPLVAKIHRDLFMDPINDEEGTSELATGWKSALTELFKLHTPIVIGYGGNDGSLMGFLESLPDDHIPGGLLWTYREKGGQPEGRIADVVARHKGVFVPIIGFDEFMLQLREIFDLEDLAEHIRKQAEEHLKRYKEQTDNLMKAISSSSIGTHQGTAEKAAVREAAESLARQQHSWWQWELRAREGTDPDKQEQIYREGLQELPQSAEFANNFAIFMTEVRKDYDEAERLFRRALALDPDDANHTGNFALFMTNVRKDYGEAERLYRRALALDPDDANHTGNFALFMTNVRKDYGEAERLYRRALALDPDDANHTGNFASFMEVVRKDYDEAERLYRHALALDPDDANHTGNFASFMAVVRKDYDEAERLYRRALALDPDDASHTGNFASFMKNMRKDYDEAERLYRRALALDPDDANHTGNFALFMADVRKDYDEAESLYRRALALDPDDATHTGNFASFMEVVRKDYDEAERLYRRALALDPDDANHTGNFASFMEVVRKDYDEAESLYRRALVLDPDDATHTGNFAGFTLARGRVEEAEILAITAWNLHGGEANQSAAEIGFYLAVANRLLGRNDVPALARLKTLLQTNYQRDTWSFETVLERASETLSLPSLVFYRALAAAILDETRVGDLDDFPEWKEIDPIAQEAMADWPET